MSTIWPSPIAIPEVGYQNPKIFRSTLSILGETSSMGEEKLGVAKLGDGVVNESPRNLTGFIRPSVNDTFYNRILITPTRLDLGSVASEQSSPIYLWNGFFDAVTLEDIMGVGEGLTLEEQPDPPLIFRALEQKSWRIRISPEGPPTISDLVTWIFDNGYEVSLPITGTRIAAWGLAIDWSAPTIERLEWLTSIVQSPSGREQRRKLRLTPRRGFKLQSIANAVDRRYIEAKMSENGGREWAVPIHQSEQRLKEDVSVNDRFIPCTTEHLNFRTGGLVILYGSRPWTNELCEIDRVEEDGLHLYRGINNNWPAGTRVAVAVSGRMVTQPNATRITDDLYTYSLDFVQTTKAEWGGEITLPTYRDRPLLIDRPEESEELTNQYIRLLEITDNRIALPLYRDTSGIGFTAQAMRWSVYGREAQARLKTLFYTLSGKWKSFWAPTHSQDLTIIGVTGPDELNITVEWCGYTETRALDRLGKRDIFILMRDGSYHVARIIGAEEVIKYETERVTVDVAAGKELSPDTVDRISFMAPMRLNQDMVEISYETDSEGVASSRVVMHSVLEDL